jgi:DNA-directed RNA polymerase, mitochondrial
MPTPATGGYVITRGIKQVQLVRTKFPGHTALLDKPVSQASLDALNTVQRTPWRINTWILDVLQEAFANGIPLPGLEVEALPPLPKKLDDAVWETLPEEDRKAHITKRRSTHEKRAAIMARHGALLERMMVAEKLRNQERIWYPHGLDFRGRLYPMPMHGPHPQGDDLAQALIHFADGVPLGPDGLYWLCIRAANTFGMDKLPLEERVQWTLDNSQNLISAAAEPLSSDWWTKAEEPWSFLATCHELAQVLGMSEPDGFISHLPIPMDGSCNGLQHLSAMGLDPVGAKATNLMSGPRQDIYAAIASRVATVVETDAAAGVPEALHWHGRVTRKIVKRAVMTTPYGVTPGGIRKQLIDDGRKVDNGWFDGCAEIVPAANYMRDLIMRALAEEVGVAKEIMEWLQATAMGLAEAALPFEWTTPAGSRCCQTYYALTVNRVKTLVARLNVCDVTDELLPRKQALAAAPNYVHSFDAAHLSMTVNAAAAEGVRHFAMIHDSYGTHAGNTTILSRCLREQFVEIYKRDWLSELCIQIRDQHPHVEIPEPPERGTFDIHQVLDAPFFFS